MDRQNRNFDLKLGSTKPCTTKNKKVIAPKKVISNLNSQILKIASATLTCPTLNPQAKNIEATYE